MRWCILIAIAIMVAFGRVSAQSDQDSARTRTFVGLRGHYGFIILHSQDLRPIKDSYPWGLELDLGKQFVSKRAWEFCNCYPRAGIALTYWNWDNRRILGHGLTAVVYAEPVFLTRHRVNLSIRMGGGLALLTRPHDVLENPDNLSYSTYLNFPLVVGLGLNYRVNTQWNLRLTGAYNHISNGGIHLPNKGINYPTASLGADYAFQAIDFKERARKLDRSPPDRRMRMYLHFLYSFKNAFPGVSDQFGIFGLEAQGVYYLGRWSGLTLGGEFVVDRSRKARIENENRDLRHERASVLLGHRFLLGRVVFSQQFGVYVYDQFQVNDPVYQRFGLLFHITDQVFAGINLKTHRHVADFADFRVGWAF